MTREGPSSRLKWFLIYLLLSFFLVYLFGIFFIILLPIPGVFLISCNKKWIWIIGAVAVFLLILIGIGASEGYILMPFFIYSLITILLYLGIERRWHSSKTILYSTLIGIIALCLSVGCLWLSHWFMTGNDLFKEQRSMIYQFVEKSQKDFSSSKILDSAKEQAQWINENKDFIVDTIIDLMPALLIGLIFFSIFIDFFVLQSLLYSSNDTNQQAMPINEWKVNDLFPWIVIVGLVLLFIKVELLNQAAINILIIMAVIYLTQGSAVLLFFLNHIKIGSVGKVIVFILGFLFFVYFYPALVFIGFADTWIDFRKIRVTGQGI